MARARTGKGATLIEAKTYRWKGHSKSDKQRYRTRDEVMAWQELDPITRLAERMIDAALLSNDEFAHMEQEAEEEIAEAVEFAKACAEPDPATILEGIYA